MGKQTNVNLQPGSGGDAMWSVLEFLRDYLLFTITRSGDGIAAFDDTGTDVFTAEGAPGANGMNNTGAWFVAQDLTGAYEWCFQRGGTSTNWEVVVCKPNLSFTGGDATTRATATDEQMLWDAIIFPPDGTYRQHLVGFDVAEVGVYPWNCLITENATSEAQAWIGHASLDPNTYPVLTGTVAAPTNGEPDPSIYIVGYSTVEAPFLTGTSGGQWGSTTSPGRAWYCMNGTNGQTEAFARYHAAFYAHSTSAIAAPGSTAGSDGMGPDPRDDSDPVMPVLIERAAADTTQVGHKGFLKYARFKGTAGRNYPDVVDIGGERYVFMRDFVLPYENGATPLV